MPGRPSLESINTILLDIEGTTTSVSFVYDVLFPYAMQHLREFLLTHLAEHGVQQDLDALEQERLEDARWGRNPPEFVPLPQPEMISSIVAYVNWLMDLDRKSTPLKSLQGKIWETGYRTGALKSHVYDDVPRAMERWRQKALAVYIYSSGSVDAQKLLFAYTEFGDLTQFICGYFDTRWGPKREPESYGTIARDLGRPPAEVLFISDVLEELAAARAAGMHSILSVREGNRVSGKTDDYLVVTSFDDLPI
jgi:enolase-phosphatase E1